MNLSKLHPSTMYERGKGVRALEGVNHLDRNTVRDVLLMLSNYTRYEERIEALASKPGL
jgi:hypothetical protein